MALTHLVLNRRIVPRAQWWVMEVVPQLQMECRSYILCPFSSSSTTVPAPLTFGFEYTIFSPLVESDKLEAGRLTFCTC